VPTNFLSPEQISRYARYNADPTPEDLAEFFDLISNRFSLMRFHRSSSRRFDAFLTRSSAMLC
jgi:hypothetical protein